MNEMILLVGGILFFVGWLIGQSVGKAKGLEEGRARGKEEGYRLGVESGRGAALPFQNLPAGTFTVVDTIQGKVNATVVFASIRVQKDDPLYDERGEIITLALPKGADPLPAPPFLLSKNPDGSVTFSRMPRAGPGASS